jgi:hypothetical protein
MRIMELRKHAPGLYWFKLGEDDDVEWIVARLLSTHLIESTDGELISHRIIRGVYGPLPVESPA